MHLHMHIIMYMNRMYPHHKTELGGEYNLVLWRLTRCTAKLKVLCDGHVFLDAYDAL